MKHLLGVMTATGVCVGSFVAAAATIPVRLVHLRVLPGSNFSQVYAVNSLGQAVGISNSSSHPSTFTATVWQNGGIVELPTLPDGKCPSTIGSTACSIAYDINDRGEIAGVTVDALGRGRAVVWRNGTVTDLGTLPGETQSVAYAINNRGQVAGTSQAASGVSSAVLWDDGTIHDLAAPSFFSPTDINDRTQIVGNVPGPSGESRAFLWDGGALTELALPAGQKVEARGINNRTQVVGFATSDGNDYHAFLWETGAITDLSNDGLSFAFDISESGQILGQTTGLGAVVWDRGTVTQLPDGDGSAARAMNDRGQFVGWQIDKQTFATSPVMWAPALHIETPNTSSKWGIGTKQRLSWFYRGKTDRFTIEVSRDRGISWELVDTVANAPGSSQSYNWIVTKPETSSARLRVTADIDPSISDVNDADIRIAKAFIDVILPGGTAPVQQGATLRVFWKHNLGARRPVALDVSVDGGASWREIVAHLNTAGSDTASATWIVEMPTTNRARVRVRALDGSGASGVSRPFVILSAR
jgi:probable HAF family extracellular repeat protein